MSSVFLHNLHSWTDKNTCKDNTGLELLLQTLLGRGCVSFMYISCLLHRTENHSSHIMHGDTVKLLEFNNTAFLSNVCACMWVHDDTNTWSLFISPPLAHTHMKVLWWGLCMNGAGFSVLFLDYCLTFGVTFRRQFAAAAIALRLASHYFPSLFFQCYLCSVAEKGRIQQRGQGSGGRG